MAVSRSVRFPLLVLWHAVDEPLLTRRLSCKQGPELLGISRDKLWPSAGYLALVALAPRLSSCWHQPPLQSLHAQSMLCNAHALRAKTIQNQWWMLVCQMWVHPCHIRFSLKTLDSKLLRADPLRFYWCRCGQKLDHLASALIMYGNSTGSRFPSGPVRKCPQTVFFSCIWFVTINSSDFPEGGCFVQLG